MQFSFPEENIVKDLYKGFSKHLRASLQAKLEINSNIYVLLVEENEEIAYQLPEMKNS